jgi:hypothetical protein
MQPCMLRMLGAWSAWIDCIMYQYGICIIIAGPTLVKRNTANRESTVECSPRGPERGREFASSQHFRRSYNLEKARKVSQITHFSRNIRSKDLI